MRENFIDSIHGSPADTGSGLQQLLRMHSRSLDSLEGRGLINEERNMMNTDKFYDSKQQICCM